MWSCTPRRSWRGRGRERPAGAHEANTRAMLTGLAGSFGYDDVTVRFEGAADPA
jgi:hypothetical protein